MRMDEIRDIFDRCADTPEYELDKVLLDITETLYSLMDANGLTKASLAEKLGKSKSWITKLLSGDHNITMRTLVQALWAMGYTMKPIEVTPAAAYTATVTIESDTVIQECIKAEEYVYNGEYAAMLWIASATDAKCAA
jgi:transcriptional regulator with XRE-family HTH domain